MRKARGFTLVEIAIVLVIVGMIVVLFATITATLVSSQRRQATVNRLSVVDAAIIQFVVQNKRLPCPADGTVSSAVATAGTEMARTAGTGCNSQTGGVVPWRALGLAEQEATDGWGRRITYRAWTALTADSAMNMSWCDPAGTGALAGGVCNTTCTNTALGNCTPPGTYTANKGYQIRNVAGTIIMDVPATGAAYVLISPGESGGGGYTSAGVQSPSASTDGTEEQKNYPSLAIQAYYVDDQISDVAGATHFDDVVLRSTVLNAVTRAGLGPRAH
jgi:prepilin-type N-terminal cleavage/methylation domain-containing protein